MDAFVRWLVNMFHDKLNCEPYTTLSIIFSHIIHLQFPVTSSRDHSSSPEAAFSGVEEVGPLILMWFLFE